MMTIGKRALATALNGFVPALVNNSDIDVTITDKRVNFRTGPCLIADRDLVSVRWSGMPGLPWCVWVGREFAGHCTEEQARGLVVTALAAHQQEQAVRQAAVNS